MSRMKFRGISGWQTPEARGREPFIPPSLPPFLPTWKPPKYSLVSA